MIIIALDHTREFFHIGAMSFSPEDLTRTTPLLFFTRWITHICAPVFMFTAGMGAFFWLRRGRTARELSHFLWKRGLWLVVLELTVLRFAVNFHFVNGLIFLSILWALGWSMVVLGFLVRVPIPILTVLSIALIVTHNLADAVSASQFGPVMTMDPSRRRRWMVRIGLGLTLAFLVVRGINVYGDPNRWSHVPGMTVLSFLRCNKYPPSLDFLLMTLGPALLLVAWLDQFVFTKTNPLIVFGRVPLFYFLVHLFVAHGLTIPFAFFRYGEAGCCSIRCLRWAGRRSCSQRTTATSSGFCTRCGPPSSHCS